MHVRLDNAVRQNLPAIVTKKLQHLRGDVQTYHEVGVVPLPLSSTSAERLPLPLEAHAHALAHPVCLPGIKVIKKPLAGAAPRIDHGVVEVLGRHNVEIATPVMALCT